MSTCEHVSTGAGDMVTKSYWTMSMKDGCFVGLVHNSRHLHDSGLELCIHETLPLNTVFNQTISKLMFGLKIGSNTHSTDSLSPPAVAHTTGFLNEQPHNFYEVLRQTA